MRIDAHQHVWQLSRGDYAWLTPALAPIFRDITPDELAPILARHAIDATILVQAAPTAAETAYLLEVAERTPFVAGVVGWADFAAPDAPQVIADLAREPLLVGLRPMVQTIADDDWLLRPDLDPAFEALIRHRLVFDALVLPRHLPRLAARIERHPDLSVVVDHGAKPLIRAGLLDPWRAHMSALAAHPRVMCKLSGLVTEASPAWRAMDLAPYVAHLLTVFGPQRLIWGSDWPVVDLAGGYDAWCAAAQILLAELSPGEREAVFGDNAARVYLAGRGRDRFRVPRSTDTGPS